MTAGDAFDGKFYEADPRFWPIAAAARRFAEHTDFPAPAELAAPGVTFVAAPKPRRARRRAPGPADGYDARVVRGEVPTRPRSWHDFLNALVWATFPASKRRLHTLQAEALGRALADGARTLPNARTRAQDALALLDEGGVLELTAQGESLVLGFGHALYEGLVRGGPDATASCLTFELPRLPPRGAAAETADRLLAARLEAPLPPEALSRRAF
ncbi:MAG TPA: DUF3025 domain-containing protein [Polyangiaceae bacterium]|nr:DUF3025 domain-containing protein [Polyangiaceae bacterium]